MGLIRIDYDQAIAEAKRLQATANECQAMNDLVDTIMSALPASWAGDAEKQFELELSNWKTETLSIKSELASLASDIKRVAAEIRAAEERTIAAISGGGGGGDSGGGRF